MLELIEEEKKKISLHFRSRLKRVSSYYQKKINSNTQSFEKAAKKIVKENEAVYNVLIKNFDKKLSKIAQNKATYASLRKKIINEICEYFGYEVSQIATYERRKDRGRTDCTQLIYYFLYLYKMGTLKEIGAELNKDSSTVYEGIGTVERYVKTDSTFRRNFNNIKERIEDILEESEKIS
jgi:chromosomal replication initiation ATPase DnaA